MARQWSAKPFTAVQFRPATPIIMKAILEFELPEDEEQYLASTNGMKWALMMWDLDIWCRNAIKYGHKCEVPDDEFQTVRDLIVDMMEDRGVKFPS